MPKFSKKGKLDAIIFDDFIKKIDPFGRKKTVYEINLKGITFISPAALVQIVAVCYALKDQGRKIRIVLDDESVCTYLARAGFVNVLKSVVEFHPKEIETTSYDHLWGSNPFLIEVTKIESGAVLPDLLNRIVDLLREKFKYKKYEAFDIATVISEVCQNTFDHNKSTSGFLAMQVYGKGTKRFLEIGIADYGDGLMTTLKRNSKYAKIDSDIDAIECSIKAGTSEHKDPTRGTGLYHLFETAYKYKGSVQIRSGVGKIRYRMDYRMSWQQQVVYIPGVQIALTLGHKKKIDRRR